MNTSGLNQFNSERSRRYMCDWFILGERVEASRTPYKKKENLILIT